MIPTPRVVVDVLREAELDDCLLYHRRLVVDGCLNVWMAKVQHGMH